MAEDHWPQYMDSWLARFCILVNACHRKPLGSHFTPVKTLDRHTDLCTCQCMKCNRWQVFSFKFHENSGKKMEKFPRSSRLIIVWRKNEKAKNGVRTIVLDGFWIFETHRFKIWMMQNSHHWAFWEIQDGR